jgi:regulator of protease activity HflC (stomatin/prohibitin superfamily)
MTNTETAESEPRRLPLRTRVARRMRDSVEPYVVGALALAGILILLFWRMVLVPIPPGHVGVLYSLFFGGTVTNYVLPEGLALKWPWNRIYIFDVRVTALPVHIDALTIEGMRVGVDAAILYRVDPSSPDALLKQIGVDYADKIIAPVARGAIRKVVAMHDTHRLYTHDTGVLTAETLENMRATLRNSLIEFYDVIFPTITLPDAMVQAIETKLKQEQIAASYEFILSSARSEAERKRIEALGLHNYYAIVGDSLSKDVLTWAGIQGTVDLSKSTNSKVVVVGGGQNQMPLILGSDITAGAATAPKPDVLDMDSRRITIPPTPQTAIDPTDPATGVARPGDARVTPLPPPPPVTLSSPLPVGRDLLRANP